MQNLLQTNKNEWGTPNCQHLSTTTTQETRDTEPNNDNTKPAKINMSQLNAQRRLQNKQKQHNAPETTLEQKTKPYITQPNKTDNQNAQRRDLFWKIQNYITQ